MKDQFVYKLRHTPTGLYCVGFDSFKSLMSLDYYGCGQVYNNIHDLPSIVKCGQGEKNASFNEARKYFYLETKESDWEIEKYKLVKC